LPKQAKAFGTERLTFQRAILKLPETVCLKTADFAVHTIKTVDLPNIPACKHLFTFQNIKIVASETYFAEAFYVIY
jgi:hypothetical protein